MSERAAALLKSLPHWWVAFRANSDVQPHPAVGGDVLPISSHEPLDPRERGLRPEQWSRVGVMTPVFEAQEDAVRWAEAFAEHHPEWPTLFDKYKPVAMTPDQARRALMRPHLWKRPPPSSHVVPVPVKREWADEFFRIYHDSMRADPVRGHGPPQAFLMLRMEGG